MDDKGKRVFTFVISTAANDDWIRAARLKKRADQGDEEARKKLEEMEKTKLVPGEYASRRG